MNTELLNRINMNDVYVKECINKGFFCPVFCGHDEE